MSRGFLWFVLVFSALMLILGLTNLATAKLLVIVFWLLVGGIAAYRLFGKSR